MNLLVQLLHENTSVKTIITDGRQNTTVTWCKSSPNHKDQWVGTIRV